MADTTYNAPQRGATKSAEYSKGKSAEVVADGVYRHPESGERAIVQGDPLWKNTQAQAFTRLGFVFEREVEPGEIKTLPELQAKERDAEASNLKGLAARMEKLEAVAAEKTELEKEVAELREKLAEKEEAERLAAEKAEKENDEALKSAVKDSGEATTSGAQEESAKKAKENAVEQTKVREQATGTTNTSVNKKEGK